MSLASKIESILFVASKPLSVRQIAQATGEAYEAVAAALDSLLTEYNRSDSGIHIIHDGDMVQMATHPDNAEVIDGFVKDEVAGELTRAQLETLTVIAYRGPVTRPELEQIRGVNCALILRNLLMRGLIEEKEDELKIVPVFTLSFEALRHLGITSVEELSEYEALHTHTHIEQTLQNTQEGEKAEEIG